MIERAYALAEDLGIALWCEDEAGPYGTVPYPGGHWQPEGQPLCYPHEYVRDGTAKLLTLFHPKTGVVRVKGVTNTRNETLHDWLKGELAAILAEQITKNGLQVHELFSSSEESWEWDDPDDARQLFPPKSEDEMKSLPMAYVIEGEFPSYFAGKPLPQKELAKAGSKKATQEKAGGAGKEIDSAEADLNQKEVNLSRVEGEGGFIPKGRRGRIAIIASSGMLKDNIVDIWARNSNAIFIMNLLDYLNDREEVAVMRSKGEQFNPLPDTGARTKTAVKYFNIAGLPALVVLFGLAVWFHRRFRQKRIQSMFGQ